MNTNANQVMVRMPDGSMERELLDNFVNASSAAIEATRRPPALYKNELVPVLVSPDECVTIDGRFYIKAPARARIANAAGVRTHGAPVVQDFERDGKSWTRVMVALSRPPIYPEPVWGIDEACVSELAGKERQFAIAKMHTRAHTRALKKLLGDSFSYAPDEIKAKGGRFLVACVTLDYDDPAVRQDAIAKLHRSERELFPAQADAEPMLALPPIDEPIEVEAEDYADPFADSGGEGVAGEWQSSPPAAPAAPLPDWARSYARDEHGSPRLDTIPVEETREKFKAELRRIRYSVAEDPAGVIALGKAGQWVDAAMRLLAWQMNGGVR